MKCIELRDSTETNCLYGIFVLDDDVISEETFVLKINKIIYEYNENEIDYNVTDLLYMLPNEWCGCWEFYNIEDVSCLTI